MTDKQKQGRRNKQKGGEFERKIVKLLNDKMDIKKVPLSGASWIKADLIATYKDAEKTFECKKRKGGFKFLYDNLEKDNVNYLVVEQDYKKPLIIMTLEEFKTLL